MDNSRGTEVDEKEDVTQCSPHRRSKSVPSMCSGNLEFKQTELQQTRSRSDTDSGTRLVNRSKTRLSSGGLLRKQSKKRRAQLSKSRSVDSDHFELRDNSSIKIPTESNHSLENSDEKYVARRKHGVYMENNLVETGIMSMNVEEDFHNNYEREQIPFTDDCTTDQSKYVGDEDIVNQQLSKHIINSQKSPDIDANSNENPEKLENCASSRQEAISPFRRQEAISPFRRRSLPAKLSKYHRDFTGDYPKGHDCLSNALDGTDLTYQERRRHHSMSKEIDQESFTSLLTRNDQDSSLSSVINNDKVDNPVDQLEVLQLTDNDKHNDSLLSENECHFSAASEIEEHEPSTAAKAMPQKVISHETQLDHLAVSHEDTESRKDKPANRRIKPKRRGRTKSLPALLVLEEIPEVKEEEVLLDRSLDGIARLHVNKAFCELLRKISTNQTKKAKKRVRRTHSLSTIHERIYEENETGLQTDKESVFNDHATSHGSHACDTHEKTQIENTEYDYNTHHELQRRDHEKTANEEDEAEVSQKKEEARGTNVEACNEFTNSGEVSNYSKQERTQHNAKEHEIDQDIARSREKCHDKEYVCAKPIEDGEEAHSSEGLRENHQYDAVTDNVEFGEASERKESQPGQGKKKKKKKRKKKKKGKNAEKHIQGNLEKENVRQEPEPSPENDRQEPEPSPENVRQEPEPSPENVRQERELSPENDRQEPELSHENDRQEPELSTKNERQELKQLPENCRQESAPSPEYDRQELEQLPETDRQEPELSPENDRQESESSHAHDRQTEQSHEDQVQHHAEISLDNNGELQTDSLTPCLEVDREAVISLENDRAEPEQSLENDRAESDASFEDDRKQPEPSPEIDRQEAESFHAHDSQPGPLLEDNLIQSELLDEGDKVDHEHALDSDPVRSELCLDDNNKPNKESILMLVNEQSVDDVDELEVQSAQEEMHLDIPNMITIENEQGDTENIQCDILEHIKSIDYTKLDCAAPQRPKVLPIMEQIPEDDNISINRSPLQRAGSMRRAKGAKNMKICPPDDHLDNKANQKRVTWSEHLIDAKSPDTPLSPEKEFHVAMETCHVTDDDLTHQKEKQEKEFDDILRSVVNSYLEPDYSQSRSPVHRAVAQGCLEDLVALISDGAEVNGNDEHGWPPLHVAMLTNNVDCAEILLEAGADIQGYTDILVQEYYTVRSNTIRELIAYS